MGVKVRPIQESDIRLKANGEVKGILRGGESIDNFGPDSPVIFGSKKTKDGRVNVELYNNKGYIKLAKPVINFFIAGKDVKALGIILKRKNILDIADGTVVYDKTTGRELYPKDLPSDMKYHDNILLGGEYITYLIDNLDVNARIETLLDSFIKSCKPKKFWDNVGYKKVFEITKDSGDLWVVADYYININNEFEELKIEFNDFFEENRNALVEGAMSPLTLLLAVREDKSVIRNMSMANLFVIPLGYRPNVDRRKDVLTKAYSKVIQSNNEFKNMIRANNMLLSDIRNSYSLLVGAVKNVTVKKDKYAPSQYKTLSDMLKGKEGHIRAHMQSARGDYTGRSVIVVDPFQSLDTIGIPKSMAPALMELEIMKRVPTKNATRAYAIDNDIINIPNEGKVSKESIACKALEGAYIAAGRQPTLYQLGIQSFKVKLVDGNAIRLNPLATAAFNADFDGDQMWVFVAASAESKKELETLMSNVNNVFLPRSGDCHIAPRHELIYGLYVASSRKEGKQAVKEFKYPDSTESYSDIYDKVIAYDMNIYDVVAIGSNSMTAGKAAIKHCLGSTYSKYKFGVLPLSEKGEDAPVTEAWFKEILKKIAIDGRKGFVKVVNRLVKLGFAIAKMFPPNISVLNAPNFKHLINKFNDAVSEREELYNMGFESTDSFTEFYDTEYAKLEESMKKQLDEKLDPTNGFRLLAESGARGSKSNLMQVFGMKGRVLKSANEAFNAIIENPLVNQLTGLEHFITAYGGRQGLIDKVIETYKPGYLSRQMSHVSNIMSIVSDDCGTEDGILITYDLLSRFLQHKFVDNARLDNSEVRSYVCSMLLGRYVVGYPKIIDSVDEARMLYDNKVATVEGDTIVKLDGLKLRSPITCANPCCTKCYGTDLGTMSHSVVGLPIGYMAAQSIGEPGTQLTMKNFQKGGVAGTKSLTSSFSRMDDYLHLYNLQKNKSAAITYDYIAPVEGHISTIELGDGTKALQILQYDDNGREHNKLRKRVLIDSTIELKDYVQIGESVQKVPGDLNVREIIEYVGAKEAQVYLAVNLFDIFKKEVPVSLKHFEVLVACMSFYVCTKGNSNFKVGVYYTVKEYHSMDKTGCNFYIAIKGIKEAPLYRNDLFATIFMENIEKGITRSIITSGYDTLQSPMVRTTFGLSLGMGSDADNYVQNRGRVI